MYPLKRVFVGAVVVSTAMSGCASQKYLSNGGHRLFANRDYGHAAETFAKEAAQPSTNQALFTMDEGSALFAAGRYPEAAKVFLEAEHLCEIKDYTSISEEVGVLVTSGNVRGYKGEDFEKVLINVYLALSYAAMGKVEDAQVEARKINTLLHRMITDGKRNYQESPFARYLSGLMWEASGNTNDAYIDYKNTYKLDPKFPEIGRDLLATANKMHFNDEYQEWTRVFPTSAPRKMGPDEGEVVVIFEQGLSPVKTPRQEMSSLPRFVPRFSSIQGARVIVDESSAMPTQKVLDIENLSINYLEDRIGRMVAAKVAGVAVKGAASYAIAKATKNDDLGMLAFYALLATDQADLRSWLSLPQTLQMVRIPLKAGLHHVRLESLNSVGGVANTKDFGQVSVRAKSKIFLVGR